VPHVIARFIEPFVPLRARAPMRAAWFSLRHVRQYAQGRRILRAYTNHHRRARAVFRAEGNPVRPVVAAIRDVGVRIFTPGGPSALFEIPPNYLDLIDRIHRDVRERLAWSANCRLFPPLPSPRAPQPTDAIPDVTRGGTIAIQLLDYLHIDGLEELCAHIMPQVEQTIFQSYGQVDQVYVYRSPVSRQRVEASWLWHYDEHPREMLKIMIYLTDVDEGTAPFEYLSEPASSQAVIGARTPIGTQSRIPDRTMAMYLAAGYVVRQVRGPRGTLILFHDNVIHRGTLAVRSQRDVVVLQIRPSCLSVRPYIDARWTGSFRHSGVNRDPWVMAPEIDVEDS
jgi:hypothetical protein